MKYCLLFIILLLGGETIYAQSEKDREIFKAMQDELERSRELKLPDNEVPFFMSFHYIRGREFEIKARLGAVMSSVARDEFPLGAVRILLGDQKETNHMDDRRAFPTIQMPEEADYSEIRRRFWVLADKAYKDAVFGMADKKAHKKNFNKREVALDDWTIAEPQTYIKELDANPEFDRSKWEETARQISAIFLEYPELRESEVFLRIYVGEVYLKNSEGTTLKYPVYSTCCELSARTVANSGRLMFDGIVLSCEHPEELSVENVKKQAQSLAERVMNLKSAESMGGSYAGPVLFEGSIVGNALGARIGGSLAASREEMGIVVAGKVPMEDRLGTKVINPSLSVKNLTNIREYQGMKVYGAYDMDAEGVKPATELVLIENGILKGLLNNRVPKLNTPESTGSARIATGGQGIQYNTRFGALQVEASETCSMDKLRKQLLKSAKKRGLDYAYIVRCEGIQRFVYKVDVRTGQETLVNDVLFPKMEFEDMRYISGISDQDIVVTPSAFRCAPSSIITPSAILLDNFVLRKMDNMDWTSDLEHPSQREAEKK